MQNPAPFRSENAFVCNLDSHWFAIRKLHGRWFNLDSMLAKPEVSVHNLDVAVALLIDRLRVFSQEITPFHLTVFLAQLRNDGYSIFVVRGTLPEPMRDSSMGKREDWHPLGTLLAAAAVPSSNTRRRPLDDAVSLLSLCGCQCFLAFHCALFCVGTGR
jgi:hypothetical protein